MLTVASGVTHLRVTHTLANTLKLTEYLLTKFGLGLTDFVSATSDTASTTVNTVEVIGFIAQLPCFTHFIALLLKHAFGSGLLASAVMLKTPPKRDFFLTRACKFAKIFYILQPFSI